jgi:beta-N-acetylhexosaminidase
MRGLAASVGVGEGAVRAIAAGADALCVGHDLHEEAVGSIHAALVASVREGRLPEARLEEAARRVAGVAEGLPSADAPPPGPNVGLEAARRALRTPSNSLLQGLGRAPLVVELVPEPGIAAGFVPYGFGEAARERWPEADVVGVGEGGGLPALPEARDAGGRPVVLVLRDAGRHPWQRALAAELAAARPDAVVIETGLPDGSPATVFTHGAGRVNLQAAVEMLTS